MTSDVLDGPTVGTGPFASARWTGAVSRLSSSRWAPWLVAAGALTVCVTLALRDPREENSYGTCPWLLVTGTHCPGCGTLRCINRLTNGDPTAALGYNVLTVAALPVLALEWARWAFPRAVGRRYAGLTAVPSKGIWGLLAVVLSFWLVRNLPYEFVAWLAP